MGTFSQIDDVKLYFFYFLKEISLTDFNWKKLKMAIWMQVNKFSFFLNFLKKIFDLFCQFFYFF
jgi:hypothetical protein